MKRFGTVLLLIITTLILSAQAGQWTRQKANQWYAGQPWPVGCNFIPSTAINQLEMWQDETFDTITINRELGWAADLGFNTVRVFLHDLAYQADTAGFKGRINTFLSIASKYGIKPFFVFFDDCWNPEPKIGTQLKPIPGVHNSGWVESPGKKIVLDSENKTEWSRLEKYIKDILTTFKDDPRILTWDLYNEPGNNSQGDKTIPLLTAVFAWAREINPSQPLTSGVWGTGKIRDFQLTNSDIITFHNYGDTVSLSADIKKLKVQGRPVICTEWMARTKKSIAQTHLPIFKAEGVGCINWGFVSGKTQTIYAWGSKTSTDTPKLWFHDLLYPDGTPYRVEEINAFKENIFNLKVKTALNPADFEKTIDGKKTGLWLLKNKNGLQAAITNYGGRVVSLLVPDKKGNLADIVLGFSNINDYLNAKEPYFGAIIGRYANRIANARFILNDEEIKLTRNNGLNQLHGGKKGFNAVVWDALQTDSATLELSYLSHDGEDGFPGNLHVKVVYKLTENNELRIAYEAYTDKTTVINLTNHSFFNLNGAGNGTINDHLLQIYADKYTPVDQQLIPTGVLAPVAGTPFDFTKAKPIKRDINAPTYQLKCGNGYDHNFVLNKTSPDSDALWLAAKVSSPLTGRVMEVRTNEEGLQFYGGNFLMGKDTGKSKRPYYFRTGFCLETQHFPDSPNKNYFPTTTLQPGDTYHTTCVYKFYVEKL